VCNGIVEMKLCLNRWEWVGNAMNMKISERKIGFFDI
jgi:hypothetical protein